MVWMIVPTETRGPERHHSVTDDVVNRSTVGVNGKKDHREEPIEQRPEVTRCHLLGQARRTPDIGKKERDRYLCTTSSLADSIKTPLAQL
jgi:hypothetical protein